MRKKILSLFLVVIMVLSLFLPANITEAATFSEVTLDGTTYVSVVLLNESRDYSINITEEGILELKLVVSRSYGVPDEFVLKNSLDKEVNIIGKSDDGETYYYRYEVTPDSYTLTMSGVTIGLLYGSMVDTIEVSDFNLDKSSANIKIGKTKELKTTYFPENATSTKTTYKSSDKKVAKVNKNGVITAVGMGTATITATVNGISKKCKVTVNNMDLVTKDGMILDMDEYIAKVPGKKIGKWTTSNKKIVKIISNEFFEAKKNGTVKLTFKAKNKKYTFNVKVITEKTIKKKAYDKLKSMLKSPNSLEVNKESCGLSYDSNGLPYLKYTIDYSAMNSLGGYVRGNFYYYYYDGKYDYTDSFLNLP